VHRTESARVSHPKDIFPSSPHLDVVEEVAQAPGRARRTATTARRALDHEDCRFTTSAVAESVAEHVDAGLYGQILSRSY
jgi:hypothetical protein